MKRIIQVVGIICLGIVIAINLIFTSYLNTREEIITGYNSIMFSLEIILIGILIYLISNITDDLLYKNDKKRSIIVRRVIYGILITIYIVGTICWTVFIRPGIVADQVHVAGLAQSFVRGNTEEYLNENSYAENSLKEYFEGYSQQIPLAFVQSLFFRIINYSEIASLRALNVIGAILIIFALYKIGKELGKSYKINKTLLAILSLTFISLPLLCTFVYGDIPALALSLLSVYFTMKYTRKKKIRYLIFSILSMAFRIHDENE